MQVFSQIATAAVMMATRCYGARVERLSDDEYQQLIRGEVDAEQHLGKIFVHRAGGMSDEEYEELRGYYVWHAPYAGSGDAQRREFISKVGSRLVDFKWINEMYNKNHINEYVIGNFVQQSILDGAYKNLLPVCELKIDVDWNIPLVRIGPNNHDRSGMSALPLLIEQTWLSSGQSDTAVATIVKYMLDHGAALGGVAISTMLDCLAGSMLHQTLHVLLHESSQFIDQILPERHAQEAASNVSQFDRVFTRVIDLGFTPYCKGISWGQHKLWWDRAPFDQTLRVMARMINFGVEENIAEQ